MRGLNAAFWLLQHGVAGLASTALLTGIPILLYIILIIVSNDLGGPLNLVIVPLLSLTVGLGTTLIIYFPIAAFFQWFASKRRIPIWLPLVIFASLSFLFLMLWGTFSTQSPPPIGLLGAAAIFTAFLTSGFVVYWLLLVIGLKVQRVFM